VATSTPDLLATSSDPIVLATSTDSNSDSSGSSTPLFVAKSAPADQVKVLGQIAISVELGSAPTVSATSTDQSGENSFSTLATSSTPVGLAISDEINATTTGGGQTSHQISLSPENSFNTLSAGGCTTNCGSLTNIAISDESAFVTLPGGGGCTTNCGGLTNTVISDESSFTTSDNVTPPNVCTYNCGGGGGGCIGYCGGGGGGGTVIPPVITVTSCSPYLKTYIKFGANNDVYEVKKLQAFLITFEGEKGLSVTGFYDQATYNAVERFQMKYNRDVLGPWGITDSTGYVFITTKLAVNNVYCGRDTANNLDLRNYYGQIEQLLNPGVTALVASSTTASSTYATTTSVATSTVATFRPLYLLGLAFVGLANFIGQIPCWWWIILLLLIIILLLAIIWTMSEDDDNDLDGNVSDSGSAIVAGETLVAPTTLEAEKEYEALSVEETKADSEVL
jgi:hypothetical protein